MVQLANNRYALVVSSVTSRPLRPRVIVHDPLVPRERALVLDRRRSQIWHPPQSGQGSCHGRRWNTFHRVSASVISLNAVHAQRLEAGTTRERLTPRCWLSDGLQEGVWLVDTRHRTILFSNAVAAALVGLDPAQLVASRCFGSFSTPQDQCFWADGAEVLAHPVPNPAAAGDGTLVPVEQRVVACLQDLHDQALLVT